MSAPRIRVGSRGSRLALIQAREIMASLDAFGVTPELVVIETQGDRVTDRPLHRVGGAGLFIKEIEAALLDDRIDVAVHSMKDLPAKMTEGLRLSATTKRLDPRDVLVSARFGSVEALPKRATMATGSLRRRAQLKAARPDLVIDDLRGNVPTRLEKLEASSWAAIVLAAAGLARLGLTDRRCHPIPPDEMVPAVGQGALGLQTRADDGATHRALARLNDGESERAVAAERSFLGRMQGGCQVPIGGYAGMRGDSLELSAFVGSVDGRACMRRQGRGRPAEAEAIGLELAEAMLAAGAAEIMTGVGAGATEGHGKPNA